MKIQFRDSVILSVIENFDEETEEVNESQELFSEEHTYEVDVFGENEVLNTIDIQFGDGSVVFGVGRDSINILEP